MIRQNLNNIAKQIITILNDKKAEDIICIECQNLMSDYCIVSSGRSSRHVHSLCLHLYKFFKDKHMHPKIDGTSESGWVMINADTIDVHLFKPELRQYYDIEGLITNK